MGSAHASRGQPRVLIIEDTALIALMVEDIVRESGCEIAAIAFDLESAREAIGRRDYDAVLLDIGLDNHRTFEIADVLLERGLPFAFVTAYDGILEPRHQNAPVILKPFSTEALVDTIRNLVGLDKPPGAALPRVA